MVERCFPTMSLGMGRRPRQGRHDSHHLRKWSSGQCAHLEEGEEGHVHFSLSLKKSCNGGDEVTGKKEGKP